MQIITFTQIIITTLYLPPKVSSNPKSQIGKNHLGLLFLKVPNPKPPEFHVLGDTTSTNLVIFTCYFPNLYHVVCEIQGFWVLGLLCLGFGIGTLGLGLCLLNLDGKCKQHININIFDVLCQKKNANKFLLKIQVTKVPLLNLESLSFIQNLYYNITFN
jgi:hypothetical protein